MNLKAFVFNSSFIVHRFAFLLTASSNDRFKNLHVASAAAKVSCKPCTYVCFVWLWCSFEKIHGGDDHAGRADAALRAAAGDESFLDCVQLFAACYAFDGFDLCSFGLQNRHKTTVDENVINQDRASAALAFAATFLRAR